jgi:predicted RNA binding protein YcfA (HicA-like mRNA interferase family)
MKEKLPIVSGFETVKALTRFGFVIKRRSGSHVILQKDLIVLSVPLHPVLKKGTLHAILKQARLSVEEFKRLL